MGLIVFNLAILIASKLFTDYLIKNKHFTFLLYYVTILILITIKILNTKEVWKWL